MLPRGLEEEITATRQEAANLTNEPTTETYPCKKANLILLLEPNKISIIKTVRGSLCPPQGIRGCRNNAELQIDTALRHIR